MLLNIEDNLIADVIYKNTDIMNKIDQEDLVRLAQSGEFTFLELDMDAVMALKT